MSQNVFELTPNGTRTFARVLLATSRLSEFISVSAVSEESLISGRPPRMGLRISSMDAALMTLLEIKLASRFFQCVTTTDQDVGTGLICSTFQTRSIAKVLRHIPLGKLSKTTITLNGQSLRMTMILLRGVVITKHLPCAVPPIDSISPISDDTEPLWSPPVLSMSASYLNGLLQLLPETSRNWSLGLTRDSNGVHWLTNSSGDSHDVTAVVELPLDQSELAKNNSSVSLNALPSNTKVVFPLTELRAVCNMCIDEGIGSVQRLDASFERHSQFSPDSFIMCVRAVCGEYGLSILLWFKGSSLPLGYRPGNEDILSLDDELDAILDDIGNVIDDDPYQDHIFIIPTRDEGS